MSFTMTRTASESFTLTHAKYLASKVTSDMWRCQQLYGKPSADDINNYGTELALLLRDGHVASYEFGFQTDDKRVLSWRYAVDTSGDLIGDERPGKIVSGVDISQAKWFNFLTYSAKWGNLSAEEKTKINEGLPINRIDGFPPKDGNGYWQTDHSYSSKGAALSRSTFRPK